MARDNFVLPTRDVRWTIQKYSLKQLALVPLFLELRLFVALKMYAVQSAAIADKAGNPLLAITHPEQTAPTNWFMSDMIKLGLGRNVIPTAASTISLPMQI
jgi:hypothetical protein